MNTLLVRMRARFSLRPDLSDIRLADGGRHLPQFVPSTVELHFPAFNMVFTGTNSSSTSHVDGILSTIDITALHFLFLFPPPKDPVVAELILTPDANHALARGATGAARLRNPVGPTDGVPAGIAKEHMVFRPLHIDVTLDPVTARILSANVSPKMRFTLPRAGTEPTHQVSNGGVVRRGDDTFIVDWRPDYVECRHNTVKGPEPNPSAGGNLRSTHFVHIHETNSGSIGSAIMRFSQRATGPSCHYIVDRDGFVVKMANENIHAQHSGGGGPNGGAAWFDIRSQGHGPGQPATISAFNNISTGVEHVHAVRPPGHDRDPTHFEVAQMQASRHLVGLLVGTFGVSRHNVLADSQTAIGSHEIGRKIGCPGNGFDWARLEAAGLATVSRAFRPPTGHPMHPTYQVFETHFGGGRGRITRRSPAAVRTMLEAMLRGLGYHIPFNANFSATAVAVEAFQLRHFGGPGRAADLARVQTPDHRPIINRLTVDTIFGVFEERAGFAY
ncbi:MAG: N-acetylmuramoyl-L-alanine amidase [Myxococcales bacterium]|nr:N-acetylmuramoyl-L-alanine amidase [Myxococcales bacterium]